MNLFYFLLEKREVAELESAVRFYVPEHEYAAVHEYDDPAIGTHTATLQAGLCLGRRAIALGSPKN